MDGPGEERRPTQRINDPREYAFINGQASSAKEKGKNSQAAHRHTATMVNRQRKLLRTRTSTARVNVSTRVPNKGLFGDVLQARSQSVTVSVTKTEKISCVLTFREREIIDDDDEEAEKRAAAVSYEKYPCVEQGHPDRSTSQDSAPLTRTLDPFLGPPLSSMIHSTSEALYSLGIRFHFKVGRRPVPALFDSFEWFSLYYREPIAFHGFNIAAAMYHDISSKTVLWSSCTEVVAHRGSLIGLMRRLIEDLDDARVELAMWGIMTLVITTLQSSKRNSCSDQSLLLLPHMPAYSFDSVFGRTPIGPEPVKALAQLLHRRGGLAAIRLPGLALCSTRVDVRRASQAGIKPFLPCLSILHDDVLFARIEVQTQTQPGRGFSTFIPSGLPADLHETLIFLCSIDVLMSRHYDLEVPPSYDEVHLVHARDLAHHRILSVEPWERVAVEEKGGCSREIYECCRLTARLYSTAVLWGMPTDTGWHQRIVKQVETILDESDFCCWPHTEWEVLLWVLVVNGIAACGSKRRGFFERGLDVVMKRAGVSTLKHLREVVGAFLWSENACDEGIARLWDAVKSNEFDEC